MNYFLNDDLKVVPNETEKFHDFQANTVEVDEFVVAVAVAGATVVG